VNKLPATRIRTAQVIVVPTGTHKNHFFSDLKVFEKKVSHMVCDFFEFAYFAFSETYKDTAEFTTN
jgi:hypothetical protein